MPEVNLGAMYSEQEIATTVFGRSTGEERALGRTSPSTAAERRIAVQSTFGAAVSFFFVVLAINRHLFIHPLIEHSDYAANALQIQNAKHFQELLGNYSRWGFHHPGPAFFYCFAFGERLLHDWLRVAPEAINAHILTIIVLNTAFLFASIAIFAEYCRSPLFVPAATVSALIVIDTINRTIPGSALVSIWMPHVLLFCFLLFATSCASVASGRIQHLPIAAFAGLMLMHGHIAQLLFVTVLAFTMCAAVVLRNRGTVVEVLRKARKQLIISGVLIGVFAFPPLLEVALHKPNNVDAIRAYMLASRGQQNSWRQALRYEISFLTFLPDPENVLTNQTPGLLARGGEHPYVVKYWGLFVFLSGILVGCGIAGHLTASSFLRYIVLEILIVSTLFLYWGTKIAGGLFNFNGHFFYSVQLLALLALVSAILSAINLRAPRLLVFLLSCAAPCLMLAAAPSYRTYLAGDDDVNQITLAVRGESQTIQIAFSHDDWPTAVGIASRLKRAHQSFCIQSGWEVMFGTGVDCKGMKNLTRLILTHKQDACVPPCRVALNSPRITAELAPYPYLTLPFTLDSNNSAGMNDAFYNEGGGGVPMWTSKHSSIRFLIADNVRDSSTVHIRVIGETIVGRPAQVALNGHQLGSISPGPSRVTDFFVASDAIRNGSENEVSFSVENAGPVGNDPRNLGFRLERVEFEAVPQD